jgi:hypothetical protein
LSYSNFGATGFDTNKQQISIFQTNLFGGKSSGTCGGDDLGRPRRGFPGVGNKERKKKEGREGPGGAQLHGCPGHVGPCSDGSGSSPSRGCACARKKQKRGRGGRELTEDGGGRRRAPVDAGRGCGGSRPSREGFTVPPSRPQLLLPVSSPRSSSRAGMTAACSGGPGRRKWVG